MSCLRNLIAIYGEFLGRTVSYDIFWGTNLTKDAGNLVKLSWIGTFCSLTYGNVGFINLSLKSYERHSI